MVSSPRSTKIGGARGADAASSRRTEGAGDSTRLAARMLSAEQRRGRARFDCCASSRTLLQQPLRVGELLPQGREANILAVSEEQRALGAHIGDAVGGGTDGLGRMVRVRREWQRRSWCCRRGTHDPLQIDNRDESCERHEELGCPVQYEHSTHDIRRWGCTRQPAGSAARFGGNLFDSPAHLEHHQMRHGIAPVANQRGAEFLARCLEHGQLVSINS